MDLPEKFDVMIVTLSDRASRGEYKDLSGPEIREQLSRFFESVNWSFNIEMKIIPDDPDELENLLFKVHDRHNLIITTGGTGIGPRDITVETVMPFLNKEIPGIMEYIRIKYGSINPAALLSRGVAGTCGKALIYTLPGSLKAVKEYLEEILKTLEHTILMQYGIDTHGNVNK